MMNYFKKENLLATYEERNAVFLSVLQREVQQGVTVLL